MPPSTSTSTSTSTSYQFPPHNQPRTWLITSGASPIGLSTARAVLAHGDSVLLGVEPADLEKEHGNSRQRAKEFGIFLREEVAKDKGGWKEKCKIVALDARCEAPFFWDRYTRPAMSTGANRRNRGMLNWIRAGISGNVRRPLQKRYG